MFIHIYEPSVELISLGQHCHRRREAGAYLRLWLCSYGECEYQHCKTQLDGKGHSCLLGAGASRSRGKSRPFEGNGRMGFWHAGIRMFDAHLFLPLECDSYFMSGTFVSRASLPKSQNGASNACNL